MRNDRGGGADRAGALESWVGLVRRRWLPGLILSFGTLVLVTAVVFLSRPVYRAEARLRLGEPPPMSGVSPTAGFFGLLRLGGDPFANDLELLASRTLAEGVVEDASLNAVLAAPRGWTRDSLFTRYGAGRETDEAAFALEWLENGAVRVRQTSPEDSLIGSVAPGSPITFGGVTVTPRPWRPGMPREVRVSTLPFADAVRVSGPRLVVERARREANVVELSFDHTDRAVAHVVVASVIARFIELRTDIQRRESGETVDSVRVVADRTRAALDRAEARLEAWQQETRLVAPEVQNEVFVERYGEILTALEMAEQELDAVDAVLGRASEPASSARAWTQLLAQPDFLANESMGALVNRLVQLEGQRAALAQRRTEANRELRTLMDEIAYLDGTLRALLVNYRTALAARIAELEIRAAEMDATFARVPSQAIELGRLERNVLILSQVLVMTEQRLHQEELRQALTFANVQVIDPPALRYKPVWPRKKLGLAVGLLLAGAFGAFGVAVAERADRTVRRAAEIRDALDAPVLAAVAAPGRAPRLAAEDVRAVLRRAAQDDRGLPRLAVAGVDDDDAAGSIARALVEGAAVEHGERAGAAAAVPPVIRALPRIDSFAAAAEAAADGGAVLVVVTCARTRRDELGRAAELLAEAGATVAGALVVCPRPRDVAGVWS